MADTRLSALIAPAFYGVHLALKRAAYREYWLKGGRGSCKSSFVSVEIIRGMILDPDANAIIYRKVADTLRDSVYAQMVWAIDKLGVTDYWQTRVSPMELIYRPTGQRILFRGADDPQKSKGVKLQKGYFKYLWFEELTEFAGMADIDTIKASVIRGGDAFTFYSYNPPMSALNWVNAEALRQPKDRLTHHSDYRSVPRAWLGAEFIRIAEAMRAANERAYRHMYLGEVTGTGGQVFDNLKLRSIAPEEWQGLHTYSGLDFGFATDPDTFVRCAYDRKRRRLYLVAEYANTGLLADALAKAIRPKCGSDILTCDSADPRSIAGLRALGMRVIGAKKGPDSVEHGMKWLQGLTEIVIDPTACPFAAKEFSAYEYDRDKAGTILPRYPDRDNHTIDAVRYSMESVSALKTAIVPR